MSRNVYPHSDPVTATDAFREYLRTPPTFPEALAFLRSKYSEHLSEELVREWYDYMKATCWCDGNGRPYQNWPRGFYVWKQKHAYFEALNDPGRLPDARKGQGGGRRKADNWRGTRKEDIGDVLG